MPNFKHCIRRILSRTNVLLVALSALLALAPIGCATNESSSYPTLKQTQINVSWPMTRYRNSSYYGNYTLAEKERANAAYTSYQAAFDQALQAAHGDYNAPTPENVKERANELITVLAAIQP